jgi:DNA-binding protein HU-beta
MLKGDLVKGVAKEAGITQADAEKAVNFVFLAITGCIAQEGRFDYHGFGVFTKVRRKASDRPNPLDRTKRVLTPAKNTVKFKPALALKKAVQ